MIAYDLEILRCIPSDADRPLHHDESEGVLYDIHGYEYATGWNDYAGMGISVITTFSLTHRIPRIFLADNFEEFCEYAEGQTLIGYNNATFDDNILRAQIIERDVHIHTIDLLSLIRTAAGEPPHYSVGLTRGSRRLGGMAGVNGVPFLGKPEVVDAPRAWQRGEKGRVIDYCMRDTMMLVGLIDVALAQGGLIDSATGLRVQLPLREALLRGRVRKSLKALDYIVP